MPGEYMKLWLAENEFLCVREGRGGTFAFGPSLENGLVDIHIPEGGLIGLQFCHTCVGLFLRLDKDRSFVAHINGWSLAAPPLPHNFIEGAAADRMREEIFGTLQIEAKQMEWDIADEYFAETVVVCCPHPRLASEDGKKMDVAGSYVIKGLRDFLHAQAETLRTAADEWYEEAVELVQEAGAKVENEDLRKDVAKADCELQRSNHLSSRATSLTQNARFAVQRQQHGFIIEHKDGEVAVVKDIAGYPITGPGGLRHAEDHGVYWRRELGWVEGFISQKWQFSDKDDQDFYESKRQELSRKNIPVWQLTGRTSDASEDSMIIGLSDDEDLKWEPRGQQ
ncbi:uncharacterized protein LTR77_007686 [Saxophila tyrrhenica]|uniref:Uncharacterized protein n=1 Tax=Saxophila tyrrhenica TaxID=1690608 RepID=A0AAV9P5R9_9PEZI|nr:hypothetical protein LTR77_007686 [Saxophila tyrrhenica]